MKEQNHLAENENRRYTRHLSPLAVWALSFGCSVGWGAFVMPGTTFLPIAGPVGTAIGIGIGALVMFVIGVNYHYLMNRFPDSGGIFSFSKNVFGFDHGFLSSWFVGLVYLAIIWANSSALPLIFRSIFGDLLQFGYLYSIAGYDVYLGEVLLSLSAILFFGFLCMRGGKATYTVQTVLALLLIAGVLVGFLFVALNPAKQPTAFTPAFSKTNEPALGALFIVFLSPWAFAGFESISNSTEEFRFPVKKTLPVMVVSIVVSALAYILLVFIASSAVPEGYADWSEYIGDLGSLSGIEGTPVFYGIRAAMGPFGLVLFGIAAASAIVTGLVGNSLAAGRLIASLSRDEVIGARFGKINKSGMPGNAALFLVLISLPIPFLGRSAIGWVVDINTIGVTIVYAYASACAFRAAYQEKRRLIAGTGLFGILISLFFLFYFLIPNRWSVSALSTQSYLMLLVWILAGFVVFYLIFRRDRHRRIGRSIVVWIVLLLLVCFTSYVWGNDTTASATEQAVSEIGEWSDGNYASHGIELTETEKQERSEELTLRIESVTRSIIGSAAFLFLIIVAALFVFFTVYRTVQKRHLTAVNEKVIAEESSHAKTTFLSNMSHDIRTPMNAIMGYVTLAKRERDLSPGVGEYLNKIESSSAHLLTLINDVLEMSRIESGKMELVPIPSDVFQIADGVRSMFATQMQTKGLSYTVECRNVTDRNILCDSNRLDRVLLNLVSNAYKFTPEGGSVSVTFEQTGRDDGKAGFRIRVKDTGIGMSPEFAAKVFEAYERERTSTVDNIQGTGLGTAITKSIVDLMGGTIDVFTEQGKGTEFVIDLRFPIDPDAARAQTTDGENGEKEAVFAGRRLLLVEDNSDNADVEKTLLEELGFEVDLAVNGEEAVEAVAGSSPGEYDAVMMDIEMPVKNGYDATRLIRSLKKSALANIPVVALTAKAFSEDIAASRRAGMNAHITKPVDVDTLRKVMTDVLSSKNRP